MVKIPGFVYLIIGAVMVGFSFYTNSKTKTASMTVFIYIGLLFVAVGIAKLIITYINKDKKPEPIHGHHTAQPVHHQAHAQQQSKAHMQHPQHAQHPQHVQHLQANVQSHYPQHSQHQSMFPQVILCRRCQARNPVEASFCNRCGFQLK